MEGYQERRDRYYKKHEGSKEKYFNKMGVYGIYVNNHLAYVGKSKNLFHRFVAHQMNTFQPCERDYNTPKYVQLRRAVINGGQVELKVIQMVDNENDLSKREEHYISMYTPPLNCVVNNHKKKVDNIGWMYAS